MKRLVERARIVAQVRAFFVGRGFLEVETPLLVPSPGLDVHLDAFEVNTTLGPRYLVTSPEYQMKRLLAEGSGPIFQIGKCFRRDELGNLHNPEFTMVEWYRPHRGMDDVLADTEALVAEVTGGEVRLGPRTVRTSAPLPRMTVVEAFARFAAVGEGEVFRLADEDEDTFYRLLVEKVEPGLAALDHGVFLTEYPAPQASLARKKPGDPRVAERFELYVAGVELCNGFGELVDPVEQRARLVADQATRRARGLPVYPLDEGFLTAMEAGMPPSGGNALGLDRLVALALGTSHIGDVMAFTFREV